MNRRILAKCLATARSQVYIDGVYAAAEGKKLVVDDPAEYQAGWRRYRQELENKNGVK